MGRHRQQTFWRSLRMRVKGAVRQWIATLGTVLMVAVVALMQPAAAHAAAGNNGLKIYEVAGAGALAGASYRQDTIILFNPTQASITCSACSIQTHSGTSNTASWTVYKLPSFTLPAGGFYMISGSHVNLATYGAVAPIPYDYELQSIEDGGQANIPTSQNILSSTTGVIALANNQTALTASSASLCATGSQLVDLVGYGSSFSTQSAAATPDSCYAGSGPAYYDGNSSTGRLLGATRKNKCIDTFNNVNDFVNVPLTYFNSSSAPQPCPTGTQLSAVITMTPSSLAVTDPILVTAKVTGATSPNSTSYSVKLNFDSPYYGATALTMYDDGTHGDATAGDGTYSVSTTIPVTTLPGFTYPTNVTVTDNLGNQYIGSFNVGVTYGGITLTTPKTTQSVAAGGVLTFPMTATSSKGYTGIINIVCTGSPNTNILGVPTSTECVATPPEVTVPVNSSTTFSLAISAGTTHSAGYAKSWPLALLSFGTLTLLTFAFRRRKHLPSALLVALLAFLTFHATGCGTDAGMNTDAPKGTYTYTVTATDSNLSQITNSIILTVNVQ